MSHAITPDEALHFCQKLKEARAKALANAEEWQELVFVFERLAKFMANQQDITLAVSMQLKGGHRSGID